MLQYQNNFVKITVIFTVSQNTSSENFTNPKYIIYLGDIRAISSFQETVIVEQKMVNCCTQMLKNCDFLVNLNLCCVLVSSRFATFLKNKFFGCFIAIINRFLLVRS